MDEIEFTQRLCADQFTTLNSCFFLTPIRNAYIRVTPEDKSYSCFRSVRGSITLGKPQTFYALCNVFLEDEKKLIKKGGTITLQADYTTKKIFLVEAK